MSDLRKFIPNLGRLYLREFINGEHRARLLFRHGVGGVYCVVSMAPDTAHPDVVGYTDRSTHATQRLTNGRICRRYATDEDLRTIAERRTPALQSERPMLAWWERERPMLLKRGLLESEVDRMAAIAREVWTERGNCEPERRGGNSGLNKRFHAEGEGES